MGLGVVKMRESGQKLPTSTYKISSRDVIQIQRIVILNDTL